MTHTEWPEGRSCCISRNDCGIDEPPKKKELEKYPLVRRCWKGYDHDLLDKLSEEGLINAAGRTYPALITPEGEAEARKLLAQYGIDTEERRRCSAER